MYVYMYITITYALQSGNVCIADFQSTKFEYLFAQLIIKTLLYITTITTNY